MIQTFDQVIISVTPEQLENILQGNQTIFLTKQYPSKATFPTIYYMYLKKDKNYKYRVLKNLENLQGKIVGQFMCSNIIRYQSEFWDEEDVYEDLAFKVSSEDPEDEDYTIKFWSNEVDNPEEFYTEREFAKATCTTYPQIKKWLGIGLNDFYGLVINNPQLYKNPKELYNYLKSCDCPEMPYCPACKYGYEYMSEDEAEFYRMGEGANTEWYCHNNFKKPPSTFAYCSYNPEGRV